MNLRISVPDATHHQPFRPTPMRQLLVLLFDDFHRLLQKEIKVLKEKLVNAGPEIVAKVSEERDKAESRVRSANRTVSDLESVVVELQAQVQRDADDNLKVCRSASNASQHPMPDIPLSET